MVLTDRDKLELLRPAIFAVQDIATRLGIKDIYQDAGGKLLDIVVETGLSVVPGRTGVDAVDSNGVPYEVKTLNLTGTTKSFSTNHHVNRHTIQKYRQCNWLFVTYDGIVRKDMYVVTGPDLYDNLMYIWDLRLGIKSHLNNPKIRLTLVQEIGTKFKGNINEVQGNTVRH